MNKLEEVKPGGNSAGKVMSSSSGQKTLPRYLRASTGSCHDLCKYGRKHASEEKPWRAKIKKTVNKLPDGMNQEALSLGGGSSSFSETKKIMAAVKKKKQVLDDCSDGASEVIIKREVGKPSGSVSSAVIRRSHGGETPSEQRDSRKATTLKPKTSPVSGSLTSGNARTQKQKVVSRSHSGQATLKSKETKSTHGKVASMGVKPVMRKADGGKDGVVKVEKKIGASRVAPKKASVTPRASFPPKSSLRLAAGNASLRKSQSSVKASPNQKLTDVQCIDEVKQLDSDAVEEKTLHVVAVEAEKCKTEEHDPSERCIIEPSISPPPPLSYSSTQKDESLGDYEEYTVSEEAEESDYPYESNGKEEEEEEKQETLGVGKKPRARIGGDSAEKARELRFRRGRDIGEKQTRNGHERRRFRKKEDVRQENGDQTGEKVVLRHQDVQDKKDAQGLFNNVIEETASKLVETRKSKVKALVGAFETVISLQESNPSI